MLLLFVPEMLHFLAAASLAVNLLFLLYLFYPIPSAQVLRHPLHLDEATCSHFIRLLLLQRTPYHAILRLSHSLQTISMLHRKEKLGHYVSLTSQLNGDLTPQEESIVVTDIMALLRTCYSVPERILLEECYGGKTD